MISTSSATGYPTTTPPGRIHSSTLWLIPASMRRKELGFAACGPTFLPYRKAAIPLIQKVNGNYNVDEIYMRPTDYSAMK